MHPDRHCAYSVCQTGKAIAAVFEELAHVHQLLAQKHNHSLSKVEKKGWEAADWKAQALEATEKLASANAQV